MSKAKVVHEVEQPLRGDAGGTFLDLQHAQDRARQRRAAADWVAKLYAEPGDRGHDPHEVAKKYPPGHRFGHSDSMRVVSSRGFERNGAGVVEVVADKGQCYRMTWFLVRPHRPVEEMPHFGEDVKGYLALPAFLADYRPDLLTEIEEARTREKVAGRFDDHWFGGRSHAVQAGQER